MFKKTPYEIVVLNSNRYELKIDFYLLFFFAVSIIGIFSSLVLNLRKIGDRKAKLLIGLFLLFHSLFIIELCLNLTDYSLKFSVIFLMTLSVAFLSGPIIYLYFKRITNNLTSKYIDALHFLPTIILVLYFSPYFFMPLEKTFKVLLNRELLDYFNLLFTIIILKAISLFSYSFLVFKLCRNEKKVNNDINALNYKKHLATLYFMYACLHFVSVFFKVPFNFIYLQIFSLSTLVLYISFVSFLKSIIFTRSYTYVINNNSKYLNSGLTESFSLELKEQLLLLFTRDKVYKENKLNLDILSVKLNTTRHNVSQVINEHFNLNFFKLVNKYRIEEAIAIFKNTDNLDIKIIDVAYDVGFNNKVTFNKAFKAQTSFTPSQFIKELRLHR